MRVCAKQCAAVVLVLAIPLFPAAGAPSGPFRHSSESPFLTTVHAVNAAKSLEVAVAPALARIQPNLEAMKTRHTWAGIPPTPLPNTGVGVAEAAPPTTMIVEEGQNPWQIASNYGISVDALLFANGLRPNQVIQVGQRLVIPSFSQVPDHATRPTPRSFTPAADSWHVVEEGDTLWAIAQRYGVSVESLAAANDIGEESMIHPGKKLTIPGNQLSQAAEAAPSKKVAPSVEKAKGVASRESLIVRRGQTLSSIAEATGVSVSAIIAANHLSSGDRIRAGQRLLIPGEPAIPRLRGGTTAKPEPALPASPGGAVLLWPSRGVITQAFGWRRAGHYHGGIDIAANRGSTIAAAIAGKVTRAGWYAGYGLAVVIDHGDGLQTIYGHASKVLVEVGDEVQAGDTIALVGCTGVCTGPHLHFEVRIDGRPVDPMPYLP